MNITVNVREKSLALPMISKSNFLYEYLTIEMVDWYYRKSPIDIIDIRKIDEQSSVVEIIEFMNNTRIIHSFTIGKSIMNDIVRRYIFYHPMVK